MDSGQICVSLKDGLSEDWCYMACPNAVCPPEAAGDCMCGIDASGVAPSPTAANCLRVANHDFDRWSNDHDGRRDNSGETPMRNATEVDCSRACDKVVNGHVNWCVGFEFRDTETGTCELYADCSEAAASPTPIQSARVAQAAPPKAARCLRLANHDFDLLFADQLDGSGNAGRRATKEDCSKLCFDESSEKHNWCVGFEFRDTEKGTCELYDECTPEVAKERKEAAAKEAAAKAAPAEKLQVAPTAARCLRVKDNDFDRWFVEHYDKTGHKPGRKATAEDCSHVCSDASSEHHSWCVGFEFTDTEKGTCELYEGCTQQQAQQSHQQQG